MTFDFDESTWLFGILLLAIFLIILRRQKRTISYIFCFSLFWVYILLVLKETLFPIPFNDEIFKMVRNEVTFMTGVNLIPLYFGPYASAHEIWRGIILNIILTVPFGFGINFIAQYKSQHILWLAIGVGLAIEGLQLAISLTLGYPYRAIDINDVLFNTIGVLIGYAIFRIFAAICVNVMQQFEIEQRGLWGYIYEVSFVGGE